MARSTVKGLTLIEIVVVIALIVVITGIYFLAANPAGQLAQSRNNERKLHLETIMQAVRQNIADQNNEQFSCTSGPLPTSSKKMASGGASGTYNIGPCLIPTYIFSLPADPSAPTGHYNSNADYDTGYNIAINSSTGQITLSAPFAEVVNGKSSTISIIR
jgi:prepilin-type N-terminal cleavage/methylation domain-containing protein